jgi:hypothetical protein
MVMLACLTGYFKVKLMTKKNSQENSIEMIFIKNWCLTIVDYFESLYGENRMVSFRKGIIVGFESGNLRGMRLGLRDMTEMALDLNAENINHLNKLLKAKFGKDLHYQSGKS